MEHIAGEYDGNTCTTKWDEEMVVAQDGMMRTDGQVPQEGSERECQVQHVDKLSSPELAQEGLHGERRPMLYTTPRQGHLPLSRKLVDRVHEVAPT